MKIRASRLLHECRSSDKTGIALEGGSRSTKTWTGIQYHLLYCQENKNKGKEITISRDRLTWLKITLMRDFKQILNEWGWWREKHFNKSESTYELWGNLISFIGLDEPAKLHGMKQHRFWINETIGTPGSAYNPSLDDFDQLEMRTDEGWMLDYNPKVTQHWIYDRVLTRADVLWLHSTQLDNPFLSDKIRSKILSYEPTPINIATGTADEVKWLIYGLGKRGAHEGVIFKNVSFVRDIPEGAKLIARGLDFGFTNDVTALFDVWMAGGELYLDELIYETGLTNSDISKKMEGLALNKYQDIIADSAEQKSIEELKRLGWRVEAALKGPDSIMKGIDTLKQYKINVTERSINFKAEVENYVWKKDLQTNKFLNIPIDDFNHGWDAVRYVALNRLFKKIPSAPKVYY